MAGALRVALVGDWPPPRGGLSIHVAALARDLAARGVDVRVLDIGRGDHAGANVRPARGALPYAAALAAVAAEGRLVHVHTSGANAKSWLVALAGGRARRPAAPRGVLTVHSGLCPAWLAASARRRALAAWACAGYARVVAVSDAIAGALAAAGVPPRRIAVLPPFSAAMLRPGPPPPALAAFRAARRPLFAAALAPGPTYGADVLLAALSAVRARAPGAGLAAFGPGTEALPGDRAGILALGDVPHGAALAVIAAADALVRPTRADGDAVSVREALALGTPVVATAIGHRPPGCLLVPAGDAAALAAAMERAAAAPRGRPRAAGADPFDALHALYRTLAAPRPLPDGGRPGERAPIF
ncbi:MAG TPA: glycosyltransferase [Anaeromyxobacter sp.]|nr:glycosyltransferase [Anaeromyxobacter sp.]